MANLEKLVKSLEYFKHLSPALADDSSLRKKEKMAHCLTIADAMCNSGLNRSPNFSHLLSISIETLLQLCDDPQSDVRMIADESLNRIIRSMLDVNVVKIQVELHKEIKKNGNARTLRAALWRFAELCHMIRPQKGKPYVLNLIPCIIQIARRPEESILETLACAMPKIFKALGSFTTDNDIKGLLKAFLQNLSSTSAVVRRTAASSILTVCLHCRKPHVFISYILNTLLDCLVPVTDSQPVSTVLGVLGCLRNLLPHVGTCEGAEEELRGSFGVRRQHHEAPQAVDRMIQVYELCLHHTHHTDHNVVNAALETLHQLLQAPPGALGPVLLSPHGITRSRISADTDGPLRLTLRSLSQMSVAPSLAPGDPSSLLDADPPDPPDLERVEGWLRATATQSEPQEEEEEEEMNEASCGSVLDDTEYSNIRIGQIRGGDEPVTYSAASPTTPRRSPGVSVQSSLQSDDARLNPDSPSPTATPQCDIPFQVCDLGTFTDAALPLLFCSRHLARSFLLTGVEGQSIPDSAVRVSVKALALSCLAAIVRLTPSVFLCSLDRKDPGSQPLSDLLLFADHGDPQLRGLTSILVASLLRSVLLQSGGQFSRWLAAQGPSHVSLSSLVSVLLKNLEDESSVCCRQTMAALGMCLPELLESFDSGSAKSILSTLPTIANNPYWLVKVRLVEVLSKLPYITIHHVTGSQDFQDKIVQSVLFVLLEDEDARVRHAVTEGFTRIIPRLFYAIDHARGDAVTAKGAWYSLRFFSQLPPGPPDPHRATINSLPSPYHALHAEPSLPGVCPSVSRIVNLLGQRLLMSSSRHLTFGCCETLAHLSSQFLTTVYPQAWGCILFPKKPVAKRSSDRSIDPPETTVSPAAGLLATTLALLTSSPVSLDLSCQQWLVQLAGNLFAGLAVNNLNYCGEFPGSGETPEPSRQVWAVFKDKRLGSCAEQLLVHVARLLSLFVHVLEETVPSIPTAKPSLPSLPTAPSLSPIKRRAREGTTDPSRGVSPVKVAQEERVEERKSSRGVPMGFFASNPHYMRIYEIVKSAHTNYKITLDCSASEKFVSLLRSTLVVLSQLLEMGSLTEAGRIAEELLAYLRSTVVIVPTATVQCVQQLLKCLFGTNLSSQWEDWDRPPAEDRPDGFYSACFQGPYTQLSEYIASPGNAQDAPGDGSALVGFLTRRSDRKVSSAFKSFNRGADKASLASYIRLFEQMVIKALKQYTVTSDVALQCRVLLLLSQLVQLRVNYCLLDSDQIFIGFVLKQFEFIEEGQIPQAEELIPQIFYFLVHLSYEKHHSKCIIGVPKIIHLCDGLMASGRAPASHCIPALVPVVEDVFLVRGASGADLKELDTQREVLVSMLLRLVEYHQVLELLRMVLSESRRSCEGEERWRRWSRQVVDTLLPLLAQGRVRLESRDAQGALQGLLEATAPIRPVDPVLRTLFAPAPSQLAALVTVERWLGSVLSMLLLLVSQGKEEVVLARLEELEVSMPPPGSLYGEADADPLNVAIQCGEQLPPEQLMAWMLLRVVGVVSWQMHAAAFNPLETEDWSYLQEQFSHFLLYCIHMFQSGSYCKVATAAIQLVRDHDSCVEEINSVMLELAPRTPLLVFQWCYLLTLLGYNQQAFWARVLCTRPHQLILQPDSEGAEGYGPSPCINIEVVRKGGTILYCDYVCENLSDAEQLSWLLVNHTEELVRLSTEPPVRELVAAVHRNQAASGLLVQAVGSKCQNLSQPSFVSRLLRCLQGVHPSQSGSLLSLLVPRLVGHPQLALARMAGSLACRRAELLLMLPPEEVATQVTRDDLQKVMVTLQSTGLARKHNGLVSLLNKLGSQCYNLPPLEVDEGRSFSADNIRNINLDKSWYLAQVKQRCCQGPVCGTEAAQLLGKLDYEDIVSVLSSKDLSLHILQDCLRLGTQLTLQAYHKVPSSGLPCYSYVGSLVRTTETLSLLEAPLYKAARLSLLQHVATVRAGLPTPHQVYRPQGREPSLKECRYGQRLEHLLSDQALLWDPLCHLAPGVAMYLWSVPQLARGSFLDTTAQDSWEPLAKFGILCLEAVHYAVTGTQPVQPRFLQAALRCADAVLQDPNLGAVVGRETNLTWLASATGSLTVLVATLLKGEQLPIMAASGLTVAMSEPETLCAAHTCHQMATLVLWLETNPLAMAGIPNFLAIPIKSLIVSLARMPLVNSYVATPPDVWRQGWAVELTGPTKTTVPPLPVDYLQDIEALQQLIFRVTLLGWTSRQQFEETWMSLLSVLSLCPSDQAAPEEAAIMSQASTLAVRAITALLVQTLLLPMPGNPNTSRLVHEPRERPLPTFSGWSKLRDIHELLCWRLEDLEVPGLNLHLQHVFQRGNIERLNNPRRYGYSQVSLDFLWTAARILEETSSEVDAKHKVSKTCLQREQCLAASGLDLHSCLHFLLDLYSQWTLPQSGASVRLVNAALSSVLSISDLFTEKAQFQWMLSTCLELGKSHPAEDDVSHQYLVLGACKAAAVLAPDAETYDRVRKMVEAGMKSSFLPSRLASLHGALYLLQGTTAAPSEDGGPNILPLAIEYIQKHVDMSLSEEHQLVMWGLVFHLLETDEEQVTETEVTPAVLQLLLGAASSTGLPPSQHRALLQGVERLVVSGSVGGKVGQQVTKLAVERLRHPNPGTALPALQLLLSCLYTAKFERERQELIPEEMAKEQDPEMLIQALEKTSDLFDRMKKGYLFEIELICSVLPSLLTDFFPPAEILNKVIAEFLSPQQPHPQLLAAVVFQVFEQVCQQSQLSLLQDWVVFSLSNFTQCYPVAMASWCLTCFFISASTNPWLRALFPHVQSRIGRCEAEDRKLLCIAAADFYHHLTNEGQKEKFYSMFEAASHLPQTPFADLVSSLK